MKKTLQEKYNLLKDFVESIRDGKIKYNGSIIHLHDDINDYDVYDEYNKSHVDLKDAAWKIIMEITD